MSDTELVKTVILSNRDRFYFSRNYDKSHIDNLIHEYKLLYASIKDIPILPNLSAQFEEDLIIKSIHGTAAIEGNPLSEEDVIKILTDIDKVKGNTRAKQEIINLRALYEYLRYSIDFVVLDEELIRAFQKLVTMNIDRSNIIPGAYRTKSVRVGDASHGGTYHPPSKAKDIQSLMKDFIGFIKSPEITHFDPVIRGAIAHYHLALIHPFPDGNGRTARFVEAFIIRSANIKHIPVLLSNYYYHYIDDYYWAFSLARKNKKKRDITPFLEFVCKGVIDSLTKTKEKIYRIIRIQTLKEYYLDLRSNKKVTQRQYDLLMSLTSISQSFSLSELYTGPVFKPLYREVTERTAQRDLKKLLDLNILLKNDTGAYELNLRALG